MNISRHLKLSLITTIILSFMTCSMRADTVSIPVVYVDNYISVRSAVLYTEEESFHIGDVLHLAIDMEYAPNRVRIANLDETLLRDSWSQSPWIALQGDPVVTQSQTDTDLSKLEALYDFQVINCPDLSLPCPGGKIYTLEDISLGIEILDDDGRVVSNTDIRFKPSPGFVSLPSALTVINGRVESFNFYFPHRAFGTLAMEKINGTLPLMTFILGLLIITGMVLIPMAREWLRQRVHTGVGLLGNRWELVLDRLDNDSLEDEEYWEGVRVAITWYCFDEYKINPIHWQQDEDVSTGDDVIDQLKVVYHEAMTAPTIEQSQRNDIVRQVTDLLKGK